MLKQLKSIANRRIQRAAAFDGLYSQMLSHYDWILRHAIKVPLPFRSATVQVRLKGHTRKFYARLGDSDFSVLGEVFDGGEYDGVWNVGPPLPPEGPRILDLGANIGTTVRMWLEQHPKSQIVAVEPSEANLQLARANVGEVDGANQVHFVSACVDAKPGQVRITNELPGWQIRIAREGEVESANSGITVPAITISQILDAHWPGEDIDLLKCDIEGAEAEIFAECGDWIPRCRRIAIEIELPYSSEQLFGDIERHGVKFCHRIRKNFGSRQVLLLWRE